MKDSESKYNMDQGFTELQGAVKFLFNFVRIFLVILIIAFLFSGVSAIRQFEEGVILRLGKVHGEVIQEPGMVLAFPYPIDAIKRVPSRRTFSFPNDSHWYTLSENEKTTGQKNISTSLKPGVDGYLITADRNIIHLKMVTKYRIDQAILYLKEVGELREGGQQLKRVEDIMKQLLNSAAVKVSASMTVEEIMNNQEKVRNDISTKINALINNLALGVEVTSIEIEASWPRQLEKTILDKRNAIEEAKKKPRCRKYLFTNCGQRG